MREELEMKLAQKYSFMRRTESGAHWGVECDCGDGWFEILDSLCGEIAVTYKAAGQPADIVVEWIKEKYGTLCFCYSFTNQLCTCHAIDFMGQGSIHLHPGEASLHEKIAKIVDKWEDESATVCEKCGKPGELRTDRYWIQTLCDDCNSRK